MSQATVEFQLGAESVTVPLDIDLNVATPLSGDVSGVYGDAHVVGDLNLTGNVYSEGLLTGIDTFRVQGNGFTWFFQNGGRADLHGRVKAAWGPWGTDTTGWLSGDRTGISPTKVGVYVPSEFAWSSWSMTRPGNSPDVTLVNGTVVKPEVVNLSQSIVFENLARGFHFHDSAGIQKLSDVKFLNCGTTGVLGNYPCHFHLLGDNSRGSVLERVVVEGGKNHAFVPHGSHGITMTDCVAYNTIGNAFWWDRPVSPLDRTEDVAWDHCLAMWSSLSPAEGETTRLTGFSLGAGERMRCFDSVATCIKGVLTGGKQTSGFHWPEDVASVWDFRQCVSHNNGNSGIFTWQNTPHAHVIEDFVGYHNALAGVNHGAYSNFYHYTGLVLSGNGAASVIQHAKTTTETPQVHYMVFEDVETDGPLVVTIHNSASTAPNIFRRCAFPSVKYGDVPKKIHNESSGLHGSHNIFEDCGLIPADFELTGIKSSSIIEIFESDVLVHRWQSGGWG